jgi:hypothetical protein
MFEKYMVLTRGFQNVREKEQIVGFQMKVRITYYRGVFLPLVSPFDVTVDSEKFKPEQLRFTYKDKTYTMDEMAKAETIHWDFGDPATLTVLKPGGLKPGIHDVEVVETVKPSYIWAGGFTGRTRRKVTLVY